MRTHGLGEAPPKKYILANLEHSDDAPPPPPPKTLLSLETVMDRAQQAVETGPERLSRVCVYWLGTHQSLVWAASGRDADV